MSFAATLKDLRLRRGKSLQELADAVGVSKPHLYDLEMGKAKNPTKDVLEKLSAYFRVSVGSLLGEVETGSEGELLGVMFRELRDLGPDDLQLIDNIIKLRIEQAKSKS